MKRLFLILVLVYLCIQVGISQIYISVETRMLELYSERTSSFSTVREKYDDNSLFEINKNLTLMTHTTKDITSLYRIKNWRHNEERDTYDFDAMSDVGNEYLCSIDLKGNTMVFVFEKDKKTYVASFDIKTTFVKDKNK